MNLPTVPTDNLYKFGVFASLLVWALPYYASWQRWEQLVDDQAVFEKERIEIISAIRHVEQRFAMHPLVADQLKPGDIPLPPPILLNDLQSQGTIDKYLGETTQTRLKLQRHGDVLSKYGIIVHDGESLSDEEKEKKRAYLKENFADVSNTLLALVPKVISLQASMPAISVRAEAQKGFKRQAMAVHWFGIGFAVFFFWCWFFRSQRYQDMILKKQALEGKPT